VCVTAASGGSLLFDQYRPFAILKLKNRKTFLDLVAIRFFGFLMAALRCRLLTLRSILHEMPLPPPLDIGFSFLFSVVCL
jgi:hypothetical protein